MSDLVANPEDRFSHVTAHLVNLHFLYSVSFVGCICITSECDLKMYI